MGFINYFSNIFSEKKGGASLVMRHPLLYKIRIALLGIVVFGIYANGYSESVIGIIVCHI